MIVVLLLHAICGLSFASSETNFVLVACSNPEESDGGLARYWPQTGAFEKLHIPDTKRTIDTLTYDTITEKIFWFSQTKLYSSHLNGTNMTSVASFSASVNGAALDSVKRRLFYAPIKYATEITAYHIEYKETSTFHNLTSDVRIISMVFDSSTGNLYYADTGKSREIVQVSADGSTSRTFMTLGPDKGSPRGMTLSTSKQTLLVTTTALRLIEQILSNYTILSNDRIPEISWSLAANESHLFLTSGQRMLVSLLTTPKESKIVIDSSSGCKPYNLFYVQYDRVLPRGERKGKEETPLGSSRWIEKYGLLLGCIIAGVVLIACAIALSTYCVRKKKQHLVKERQQSLYLTMTHTRENPNRPEVSTERQISNQTYDEVNAHTEASADIAEDSQIPMSTVYDGAAPGTINPNTSTNGTSEDIPDGGYLEPAQVKYPSETDDDDVGYTDLGSTRDADEDDPSRAYRGLYDDLYDDVYDETVY